MIKPLVVKVQGTKVIARQQGNAAIEFVLILFPLLLLLCALVSYASYFLLQQRVNHTVGDVARIVSLQRFELDSAEALSEAPYEALVSARLADDSWLKSFSQRCSTQESGLCHRTKITPMSEGCSWLAAMGSHHKCVKVVLAVDVEGWLLTDLLRLIGRAFSDTTNWVPKYASASAVVRLQNNR